METAIKTLSISGNYVELVQMLGVMLRQNLGFVIGYHREQWDFYHVATWEALPKKTTPPASSLHDNRFHGCTNHLYFASGEFLQADTSEIVEIRAICQMDTWRRNGLSIWKLQVWTKTKGDEIPRRYFFHSHRGFGGENNFTKLELPKKMTMLPPKNIRFSE